MISILIPVKNEQENISKLIEELDKNTTEDDTILFIDDGSTDNTVEEIEKHLRKNLKLIELRKNYGKSTALSIGMAHATQDYIFTIDGDLQDDCSYLPAFMKMIREHDYDCIVGHRFNRLEQNKRLPSRIYNWISKSVLGLKIQDMNCGMKLFKRCALHQNELYGEMHRYLPAIMHMNGFKVGEYPIRQRQRAHGVSKYKGTRIFAGMLDLMTVFFLYRYGQSPLYLFSIFGAASFVVSALFFSLAAYRFFTAGMVAVSVMLGSLFFIVGLLCFITGLLSEQINKMGQATIDKTKFIKRKC